MSYTLANLRAALDARLIVDVKYLPMRTAENNARILALTMIGEGAGEPLAGRIAIAHTVMNRVKARGGTVVDRCLQPWQYSCWNENTPNTERLLALAEAVFTNEPFLGTLDALYRECVYLAGGVITGALMDKTRGATHYCTTALLESHPPAWAVGQPSTAVIGHHTFFADIPWA